MRSLYWLTAVTLVAAAVTTVAIADYGRRHPQTVAAWWGSTPSNTTSQNCCDTTQPQWVTEKMTDHCAAQCERVPILPPLPDTASNTDAIPALPAKVDQPIRVEDVPEHQKLKEEAFKSLTSFQPDPPALPPSSVKKPTPVVDDEFTFNEKPLAPLYVPLQPDAKVVLPPTKMMQDVAKLPNIPGVSLNPAATTSTPAATKSNSSFNTLPSYPLETTRGPEVMPGLHAAKPVTPDEDNPVRDSMLAFGELISAINPTTYLMSLQVQKKPVAQTAFASPEGKVKPATPVPVPCDDLRTCPATTALTQSATCAEAPCCKTAVAAGDDIVVRTYSVSEFTASASSNHDELIRLVTTMVAPESWSTRDSNIEYFPLGKCLVVRHRSSVQNQVEDLLTQLRGQVQKQHTALAPSPVVRHEPTATMPVQLELVPLSPRECQERMPRVITIEPNRCTGEEELLTMIPMTPEGKLMPVPMTLPKLQSSSLVPAQFEPKTSQPVWLEEGPVRQLTKPRPPEFFPWFLPYAPLPNGPDSCEEELLNRTGFVSYTDEEIGYLFLLGCEWEERQK